MLQSTWCFPHSDLSKGSDLLRSTMGWMCGEAAMWAERDIRSMKLADIQMLTDVGKGGDLVKKKTWDDRVQEGHWE